MVESVRSIFDQHNYGITDLLNDLHHLKYDHKIDADDVRFEEAFRFFTGSGQHRVCRVSECGYIRRHHRDRSALRKQHSVKTVDLNDGLLLDTMALIHCYLVHSLDVDRLTQSERDRVQKATKHSDDGERLKMMTAILSAKRKRLQFVWDDRRYRGGAKLAAEKLVDFKSMSRAVAVDEVVLAEGLREYEKDRDRLMGDLIDVVYAESIGTAKGTAIWDKLLIDGVDRRSKVFRCILYGHFECTHLDSGNFSKISRVIVDRKALEIDADALEEVAVSDETDGRMFDKTDPETYRNMGAFVKRFQGMADFKGQHLRLLYRLIRSWKYIECAPKESATPKPEEEEKEVVDHGQDDEGGHALSAEQRPDVYEIGKRFYFWNSHRKHPDFVPSRFGNMKEEMLHSPLLSGLMPVEAWNALTVNIAALVETETAHKITSNGHSEYMHQIAKFDHFDAQHLRSLKLYTDFTELSAAFCSILRRSNPAEIGQVAHWTRTLTETVQCFGSSLRETAVKTYYRGVNRTFIFKMIATRFHLPLSTTTDVKSLGSVSVC